MHSGSHRAKLKVATMKRSRKAKVEETTHDTSDGEESTNEDNNRGESKVPTPSLTLFSALNAPGSNSPQMRLLAQIGAIQSGNQSLGARFTLPMGLDSSSGVGHASAFWEHQQQDMEQHQLQLLRAQILLQQQQHQQQQEQAFIAAAMASSGAGSLQRMPASLGSGGHHLATLGSTLAARAQLEKAHAQLRSQAMLERGGFSSNEGQTALSALVRPHDMPVAASKRDDKLPYYYDTSKLPPDPPSDDEVDDDDNQGSVSEMAGDPSTLTQEKFPFKLYRMLDEAESNGDDSIVSFFPHGRAFAIHKPREFVSELMPKYFSTSRMSSFQRQLNLYGFRRITDGRDKGGYFHEYFLRGRKGLCKKIHRKKAILRSPPETSPQGAPDGVLESPYAAASTSGLNPVFLAQLSQPNLLQRQPFGASLQQLPPTATGMSMQHASNQLLGIGNLFGGLLPQGFGGPAQPGALTEAGFLASEMASIDRHRSDLLRQLFQVQQQQYGALPENENETEGRSDSSNR